MVAAVPFEFKDVVDDDVAIAVVPDFFVDLLLRSASLVSDFGVFGRGLVLGLDPLALAVVFGACGALVVLVVLAGPAGAAPDRPLGEVTLTGADPLPLAAASHGASASMSTTAVPVAMPPVRMVSPR